MDFKVGQTAWSLRNSPFSNKPRHVRKCKVTKIEPSRSSYIIWCYFQRDKHTECYMPEDIGTCLFHTHAEAEMNLEKTKY